MKPSATWTTRAIESRRSVERLRQGQFELEVDAAEEEVAERGDAGLLHEGAEIFEVLRRRDGLHLLGNDLRQDQPGRVGAEETTIR